MIHASSLDGKIRTLAYGIFVGTIIIIVRLIYLQLYCSAYFLNKSKNNFLRVEKIVSPRGAILDRNGIVLATNRPLLHIYWQGTGNKKFTDRQCQLIQSLESVLEKKIDEKQLELLQHVEKTKQKMIIASDVSFERLSKIAEQCFDQANIFIEKKFERYYPYEIFACHILGYLATINFETIGKMGLENIFDSSLKGSYGTLLTTINSLGIRLEQQEVTPALMGNTIQTTLDYQLQELAEEVFAGQKSGCLILMDPYLGDIKALVSRPAFDPSVFLKPLSSQQWHELQDQQPFLNRAFNACYPPASLFKLISLAAALETKLIPSDLSVTCKGSVFFGSRRYRCRLREGHGTISIKNSVAQSCNILFYLIGKHINIDTLMDYANRFGLGRKTGIIFQEKEGLMPTRAWKQKTLGEPWWQGDTLQATIGQTYLLTTPIQIARMISSIFTGYLVTPRITLNEIVKKEPLRISSTTRTVLQDAMHAVVESGTGRDLNRFSLQGFNLYAKTGTGQTSHLSKRKLGGAHLEHAWSAVYFTYKNEHPLTLVVLVEHAGSSYFARACIKQFLRRLKQYKESQLC